MALLHLVYPFSRNILLLFARNDLCWRAPLKATMSVRFDLPAWRAAWWVIRRSTFAKHATVQDLTGPIFKAANCNKIKCIRTQTTLGYVYDVTISQQGISLLWSFCLWQQDPPAAKVLPARWRYVPTAASSQYLINLLATAETCALCMEKRWNCIHSWPINALGRRPDFQIRATQSAQGWLPCVIWCQETVYRQINSHQSSKIA